MEADQRFRLLTEKGEVFESEDTIILEDVPIVTPNKDVVATGLSFQVREKQATLACSTIQCHVYLHLSIHILHVVFPYCLHAHRCVYNRVKQSQEYITIPYI